MQAKQQREGYKPSELVLGWEISSVAEAHVGLIALRNNNEVRKNSEGEAKKKAVS
jgi:hypothetical protein